MTRVERHIAEDTALELHQPDEHVDVPTVELTTEFGDCATMTPDDLRWVVHVGGPALLSQLPHPDAQQ